MRNAQTRIALYGSVSLAAVVFAASASSQSTVVGALTHGGALFVDTNGVQGGAFLPTVNDGIGTTMLAGDYEGPEPLGGTYSTFVDATFVDTDNVFRGNGVTSTAFPSSLQPAADTFGPGRAYVGASVTHVVTFDVERPTTFSVDLVVSLSVELPGTSEGLGVFNFALREATTNDTLLQHYLTPGIDSGITIGDTIMLDAGRYVVVVSSQSYADDSSGAFGGGFRASTIEFDYGVTVLPTPASAALLGVAGIAAVRRRR
ncbi:MAG: hypothetical protein AAGB48_07045 [Planctomycetota bacterium]